MALRDLRARLGERFADVWVLLSDTDNFLSRARLKPRYDRRLREWRQRLQESRGDPETTRTIRDEIVAVRRALRSEGWELRLGSLDVTVKGFRGDDSMARGFSRMVLYLAGDGAIYHAVGEANHIALDNQVRQRLAAMKAKGPMEPHYLWYRVSAGEIELAGADSESRDQFEQLKVTVDERKSDLVRAFRRLS